MKNFVQELKLNFILTALFCILCGAVLFVWRICRRASHMVTGAILVLMGIIYFVSFLSALGTFIKQVHLVLTIVFVVIVWILLKPVLSSG